MGRANIYLSDELEARVKAARIPLSEVCQRALLGAVEQAERGADVLEPEVRTQLRRGQAAGREWVIQAPVVDRLRLLRDGAFAEVPADRLPGDLFRFNQEQRLAWEAGFVQAARDDVARMGTASPGDAPQSSPPPEATADRAGAAGEADPLAESSPLGDGSGCRIGQTVDGDPVSFDPHAAPRAGKSPLFALIGPAEQRVQRALGLAQDAAARGGAVLMIDLAGRLSARAANLGGGVRVVRRAAGGSSLTDLLGGLGGNLGGFGGGLGGFGGGSSGPNLGALWESLSAFAGPLSRGAGEQPAGAELPAPGHVTVLDLSGDGNGLSMALSLAQAGQLITGLAEPVDHSRLIMVELPDGVSVPGGLAGRLGALLRATRERDAAVGLSVASAEVIERLGGGSLLSTVFAFPTASPAEGARLRDLLGPEAPILQNAPGFAPESQDETWVVMRDLEGRLGQVRLDPS